MPKPHAQDATRHASSSCRRPTRSRPCRRPPARSARRQASGSRADAGKSASQRTPRRRCDRADAPPPRRRSACSRTPNGRPPTPPAAAPARGARPAAGELPRLLHAALALDPHDYVLKPLQRGSSVIAGTVLGRIGKTDPALAPHVEFAIRPAGRGAPQIDPKPILDGWKLLESTAIYRAKGKNAVLRGQRERPLDRPDHADEQGAAAAFRARRPAPRDLRVRPPGHRDRRDRPARAGHARVPLGERPQS